MSQTNFNNNQHNSYSYPTGDKSKHTHDWYKPATGQMGEHGENASKELKRIAGREANKSADSIYVKSTDWFKK